MRLLRLLPPLMLAATSLACVVVLSTPMTWTQASPDPAVLNLIPASFVPGSGVTEAVLTECGVAYDLPQEIARWTPVPVVLTTDPTGATRVLSMQVTHILAPGGGPWSGPKSMTVHGELQEARPGGWVTVASFDVRRTTTRGGKTCEMLDIIAEAIGKDIRPWLAAPTLNARLGEL